MRWDELSDAQHGGKRVRLAFWWEPAPVLATFVRRGDVDGFQAQDGGQVATMRHVIRYDQQGEQATSLPVDAQVELVATPAAKPARR